MSQNIAQTLRSGGRDWKNKITPSQPSPGQSTPAIHKPMPSVVEDDDFQTVQHGRSSNAKKYTAKQPLTATSMNSRLAASHDVPLPKPRTTNLNPSWRSNASVAAAARVSVYNARKKPGSIYKESCMPVAERDQALMQAQNSRGVKVPKESYRPGMLIRAAIHEPDLNHGGASTSNITVADRYRSETKFGPIHTKVRKAIVIALYQDHYLAVPLYTHNGNGLLKKQSPEEFVSVRDHRNVGAFQKLSKHAPLMTEHLNAGINPYHEKSTAHITYPIARKYDLSVVHEGHLQADSIKNLLDLFNEYAPTVAKV